jgi:hypothetical protein
MVPPAKVCQGCSEPISLGKSHCAWCSISENDALKAALDNRSVCWTITECLRITIRGLKNWRGVGRRVEASSSNPLLGLGTAAAKLHQMMGTTCAQFSAAVPAP